MTLHFLKMTAEKYYEYHVLLLPGIYQVNPIDLGFTLAFISNNTFSRSCLQVLHLQYMHLNQLILFIDIGHMYLIFCCYNIVFVSVYQFILCIKYATE
jgi:hypothetical protein